MNNLATTRSTGFTRVGDTQIGPGISPARKSAEIKYPEHIETFLSLIRTRFAQAKDAPEFDKNDVRVYVKLILPLTPPQCRDLIDKLRADHLWRPSPATVREAIDELLDTSQPIAADLAIRTITMSPQTAAAILADPNASPENQAIARKVLGEFPALPSTGEGPGRSRAREILNNLRQRSGLPPKESMAATAKYSAPNNHGN
ncbi:hypothetical protein [Armatimonas rosea]|uniref:Uncharacterized protein n=1 Tax=Armatimonas rosea TaxID=685828 RepID=A0A7W9SVS2_ARMRO|nr:hypothetical protein [Armatimonas rosea]MBB6053260.1 hypothetical protein [Armatimonas rosea]